MFLRRCLVVQGNCFFVIWDPCCGSEQYFTFDEKLYELPSFNLYAKFSFPSRSAVRCISYFFGRTDFVPWFEWFIVWKLRVMVAGAMAEFDKMDLGHE